MLHSVTLYVSFLQIENWSRLRPWQHQRQTRECGSERDSTPAGPKVGKCQFYVTTFTLILRGTFTIRVVLYLVSGTKMWSIHEFSFRSYVSFPQLVVVLVPNIDWTLGTSNLWNIEPREQWTMEISVTLLRTFNPRNVKPCTPHQPLK